MRTGKFPLAVVIAALIQEGRILLIKRRRGDYVNLWGLPGGKVERDEHLSEAAVREIAEECGIDSEFKRYLGLVSEHLREDGRVVQHFLLHVCELIPRTCSGAGGAEGELRWCALDRIGEMGDEIIPSDLRIIEKMVCAGAHTHYNCVLEKKAGGYLLVKFIEGEGPHRSESQR
ncbi:MAG: NUDIX domain-containing protein [Candidatus Aureabacteria bacterium]|nr:NUDIX domain-containing protein [Candidatus Auribacterota bacterium]